MDGRVGEVRARPGVAAAWLRPLFAVGVGVLTGGFAAWAYYDDVLRPLSHTFGLWITAVALLSARRTRVLAVTVLGAVFAGIGTPGRAGSIGTTAAVGLLAADAHRCATSYPGDGPVVVGLAVLAVVAVLVVAVRTPRELPGIAAWSVPALVGGLVLVSAPDLLEQLLPTGGL